MSTRSILGLIYMAQGLTQLGHDPEPVLQQHGMSMARLDPTARIDRTRELRIYADWADHLSDPLIGLKLGECYSLAGYGPLVMLLMTCTSAYEALQVGIRYQQLTYLFGHLRLEPGEKVSALILEPMAMPNKVFRFRVDGEVSGTYKMLRDMQTAMGVQYRLERVDMPYAKPPQAAAYDAHFGCPVRFGEREARFWIRNDILQFKLPTADANAHAMFRALCDQQLQSQKQDTAATALADRVLAHFSLFNNHFPSAQDVAKSFGMSERSLRRQLSEDGQCFRDLLASARYARARHLLKQTQLTIEEVAIQLDYAESAAFIHAFRRWAGQSPNDYRNS